MIKRIIAVTNPAFVRLEKDQLVLEHNHTELGRVPCEDIGALILEHPQITITRRAMSRCLELGAAVLICDEQHMPNAILQPFQAHSLHAKYLRQQIVVSEATHKRIWRQIVSCKIRHQGLVLERLQRDARHLTKLSKRVKSGDKENLEAQAAKVYWRALFGTDFRRRVDGGGINGMLNYGYAIVRAAVARTISATGLHPALGIHHSNQYNAFALADDLVEPLRPMVDYEVFSIVENSNESPDFFLTPELKQRLLGLTAKDCVIDDRQLPLMVALQSYVASFRRTLFKEDKTIVFPVI